MCIKVLENYSISILQLWLFLVKIKMMFDFSTLLYKGGTPMMDLKEKNTNDVKEKIDDKELAKYENKYRCCFWWKVN